jgi:hypothetical protein
VLIIYCSASKFKQAPRVGVGVGTKEVAEGVGVTTKVLVGLGVGIAGYGTITLAALATQLPITGKVIFVQLVPESVDR